MEENTVLLVDDEEVLNAIHEKLFKSIGFSDSVFTFSNGKCALEYLSNITKISKFPKELFPKYIFLDIDMPIMDGNQFFSEFVALYKKNNINLPKVIILTSAYKPENIFDNLGLEVQFSKKPLSEEMLKSLVQ